MALNPTTTANDVVAAIKARNPMDSTTETQCKAYWTDIMTALFNRIKADMVVTSSAPSGTAVATTGTASAQTGATTAPAVSTSTAIT